MKHEQVPSRAEIDAMTDVEAIQKLLDEVETSAHQIEAQLEFVDRDDQWRNRACAALASHRTARRLLAHRLARLQGRKEIRNHQRSEGENLPLTNEIRVSRPAIDVNQITTVKEIDRRIDWLAAHINAVESDRMDEISRPSGRRDEAFLAWSGTVLREMRGVRQALQTKRGELSRAAKAAETAERESTRERLFIDVARECLSREAYQEIWAGVDARMVRLAQGAAA